MFLRAADDSVRYKTAIHLYDYYEESNRDSAFYYAEQTVQLSRKNKKKLNEAYSLNRQAYQELNINRFEASLHHLLDAFSICENKENDELFWEIDPLRTETRKRLYVLSTTHHIFGILMSRTGNREQEIFHFKEAKKIAVEINNPARSLLGSLNLGRIYRNISKFDSALYFVNEAATIAISSGRRKYLATILYFKGLIHMDKGDSTSGLHFMYESIKTGMEQNNNDGQVLTYHALTGYHIARNNRDSGLYYAQKNLETLKKIAAVVSNQYHIGTAYEGLYRAYYLMNQFDSAYKYLVLAHYATDSINKNMIKSLAEFQGLTLSEQQRLQNAEKEKVIYRNKVRTNIMLGGIGILLLLAIIFYRNNLQKQKAKVKIERAYDNLKATQQQLIQSEKMASLGELTAGIAHEIQNPLNFVNNFSDVSAELLNEMLDEVARGNYEEVKLIVDDVKQNLEKIHHHGKRADSIVKGMLQHSRSSSGQKELTDINNLADEYLRLAFHGLRAKDKSFNVDIKTDFDRSLEHIEIVPQEIGRVLVNVLNNAFYAVNEKRKKETSGYEPVVTLSTQQKENGVEICVKDNGNGIPEEALEKIFQPFFTTKPTGQGTGLGLSLSYDIVKSHGGDIKVETKPGEGSIFILILPGI